MNFDDPRNLDFVDRDNLIRSLQIVVTAMIAGLLAFATIALVQRQFQFNLDVKFMTWIGIIFFLILAAISLIIPQVLAELAVDRIPASDSGMSQTERARRLFGAFQIKTIVGAALLEGAGFFNLLAYWIDGCLFSPIIGCICLIMLGIRIPSRLRVLHWIAERLSPG